MCVCVCAEEELQSFLDSSWALARFNWNLWSTAKETTEWKQTKRNGQRNKPHVIVFNDRLFVFSLSRSFYSHYVCVCHPGSQEVVNVSSVQATSKFFCTWTGCSNSWTRLAGFLTSFNLLYRMHVCVCVCLCMCVWVTLYADCFIDLCHIFEILARKFCKPLAMQICCVTCFKVGPHKKLALKSYKAHSALPIAFVSRALIANWKQTAQPSSAQLSRAQHLPCSLSTYNFRLNTQRTKRATYI